MPDDGPDNLPRASNPASSTGRLIAVSLVALALVIRLAPVFVRAKAGLRRKARPTPIWTSAGRWPTERVSSGRRYTRAAPTVADILPGYPFLVALADWSGLHMRALVVLQALAGAAALVLALAMGLRLAGLWAGIVAAALLVFDPLQVVYCNTVSPQVPMSLALVAMAAAGLKFILAEEAGGRRSWPWAAAAGAALAVAAYFDWTVLGLVVVAGLAALVAAVVKRRWRLLRGWAVGLAVVAACLAPWVVRNDVVLGRPVLVTSAGPRLLDGFWPDTGDPQDVALRQKLADADLPRDEVGLDRLLFLAGGRADRAAARPVARTPGGACGRHVEARTSRAWGPGSCRPSSGTPAWFRRPCWRWRDCGSCGGGRRCWSGCSWCRWG